MRAAAWALGAALIASWPAPPAAAAGAQVCLPRADMLAALEAVRGEQPVGVGVSDDGELIVIVAAEAGQTWTILLTEFDGLTCVLAAGEAWREMRREPAEPRT